MQGLLANFFTRFTNRRKLKRLLAKAKAGDLESKKKLIDAYETGDIVKRDLKQSRKWLISSASAGCADSQFKLYKIYSAIKNETPELREKKMYWLRQAAHQEHPAALKAAVLHINRRFTKNTIQVDEQEKAHWLTEIAHQEYYNSIAPEHELIREEDDYHGYCNLFNRYSDENLPTSDGASQKRITWDSYDEQLLTDAVFIGIPEEAILEAHKNQADFILDRIKEIQLNPNLPVSEEICASNEETVKIITSEHCSDYCLYIQNFDSLFFDELFEEGFREENSFYPYQPGEGSDDICYETHPVISELRAYGVSSVWHMTHYKNIESILEKGLNSKSNLRRGSYTDISDQSVQGLRTRSEPIYRRKIHDYVPTYINIKNPMLYVRKNLRNSLCLIEIDITCIENCDFLITDGNAAASKTNFFNQASEVQLLPWHVLNANYWHDFEDGKRKRCAELLLYPEIKSSFIKVVHFHSSNEVFDKVTNSTTREFDIKISPELFF